LEREFDEASGEGESLGVDISMTNDSDLFGSGSIVHIKAIVPGGLVDLSGSLHVGDKIVKVNGVKLVA
jgi:C-terminal processing protease CtpA/Prc